MALKAELLGYEKELSQLFYSYWKANHSVSFLYIFTFSYIWIEIFHIDGHGEFFTKGGINFIYGSLTALPQTLYSFYREKK